MKKILLLFLIYLLVGCSTSENYNKETKTLICTQEYKSTLETGGEIVDDNYRKGIMERTFWVEDGLLVKYQLKFITPVTEFEDIEQELASDLEFYENAVHEFEGLSVGKPYIDGENYIGPISIEDYTNLQPYLENEYIPRDVLNKKGDAIIFDLYYENFIMNDQFNTEKPTCSIQK